MSVDDLLEERGKRYGEFSGHAMISQLIKAIMRDTPTWDNLDAAQKESLEMIAHKIARILNGDPDYLDNWDDTAGYATLVANELRKK